MKNGIRMSDIAKELGVAEPDVVFALDAISDPVSLYDPVFKTEDDTLCVLDQLCDWGLEHRNDRTEEETCHA